ncbi:MAG: hypothetical protein GY906_35845 [bacterium]|nr:hypothetical protein [bacterium]
MEYLLFITALGLGGVCAFGAFLFSRRRAPTKRSQLSYCLTAIIVSIGIGLLIAELAVSFVIVAVASDDREETFFDAELGWSRPPRNRVHDLNATATPSRRPDVVIVGDSVAFGHGVKPEEGMVHQARLLLEPNGISILNAAVSGYGVDQSYLYVKRHVDSWQSLRAVVVVLFSGNDFTDTASNIRYGKSKPQFRFVENELQLSQATIRRHSLRNTLSASKLIFASQALIPPFHDFLDDLSGKHVSSDDETKKVIESLLAELSVELDSRGTDLLLLLVPGKGDIENSSPTLLWFQVAIQRYGDHSVDLLPFLQETSVGADDLYLANDSWHLSVRGNAIAGEILARTIHTHLSQN